MNPSLIRYIKPLAFSSLFALTSGCASKSFNESLAIDSADFHQCSLSAYETSVHAQNPAMHNLAAKQALACIDKVNTMGKLPDFTALMKLHIQATVDFIKAGELVRAQETLAQFKADYPNKDLYLSNGSSLLDSLDLILGNVDKSLAAKDSLLNAHPVLKGEYRRQQFWEVN